MRAHLAIDAIHKELQRLGDKHHTGDTLRAKQLEQRIGIERTSVQDATPTAENRYFDGHFKHMAHRQDREGAIIWLDMHDRECSIGIEGDVAMAQHHTLGLARRARGEDELCQVIDRKLGQCSGIVCAYRQFIDIDKLCRWLFQGIILLACGNQVGRVGGLRYSRNEVFLRVDIQGDSDSSCLKYSKKSDHPVDTARRPQHDALAFNNPLLLQIARELVNSLSQCIIRKAGNFSFLVLVQVVRYLSGTRSTVELNNEIIVSILSLVVKGLCRAGTG